MLKWMGAYFITLGITKMIIYVFLRGKNDAE